MEIQPGGKISFTFSESNWIIHHGKMMPQDIRRKVQIARKEACAPHLAEGLLDSTPDVQPSLSEGIGALGAFVIGNQRMEQVAHAHFNEEDGQEKHVVDVTLSTQALETILTAAEIAYDIHRETTMSFDTHNDELEFGLALLGEKSNPTQSAIDNESEFKDRLIEMQVTGGIIAAIKAASKN